MTFFRRAPLAIKRVLHALRSTAKEAARADDVVANMEKNGLRVPGPLKHAGESRSEADLQKEMRTYVAAQPGVRFLADVLTALHAPPQPLRTARAFYAAFPPRLVLAALGDRAELRVRLVRAITGGAPTLLRRLSPADLAAQIELLVAEDLPASERALRAEEDRGLPVLDLYLKYLDATDLAAYLPVSSIWDYESSDTWWTRESGPAGRALMAGQLKSIRRHGALTDSEFLDVLGDETLERDLSVAVRTNLRAAARKAARDGKPFRDSDLFASVRSADGNRDLIDEMADSIALPTLRKVVVRAAEILGLLKDDHAPAKAETTTKMDTSAIPRAIPTPTPAPVTPAPGRTAPPSKTGKHPPTVPAPRSQTAHASQTDTTPIHPRSRTQPVPTPDSENSFADEEVVGPDTVVMIDEITS